MDSDWIKAKQLKQNLNAYQAEDVLEEQEIGHFPPNDAELLLQTFMKICINFLMKIFDVINCLLIWYKWVRALEAEFIKAPRKWWRVLSRVLHHMHYWFFRLWLRILKYKLFLSKMCMIILLNLKTRQGNCLHFFFQKSWWHHVLSSMHWATWCFEVYSGYYEENEWMHE